MSVRFRYLIKTQCKMLLVVLMTLAVTVFAFSFLEVLRISYGKLNLSIVYVVLLSSMRIPYVITTLFPYIYLIATTVVLLSFSKTKQSVILRATGHSPFQIISPFIACSVVLSIIWLFCVHPLSVYCQSQIEMLEHKYMNISKPMKSDDIWLHQEHCNDDSMLIHIGSIEKNFFKNVTIYKFNKGNVIDKIFAEHAEIQEKKWILKQGMMVNHSSGDLVSFKEEEFQTSINDKVLKNYSKDPQDMGFFELFKMFKLRRKIEVVAKSYELNMNFLVATSVLIPVVVLVSALFCFPLDRSRTRVLSVPGAIFSGLLIYFLMSIFRSLGSSGALPIWVSAWTPVLLTIFCSIYLLIKEEES